MQMGEGIRSRFGFFIRPFAHFIQSTWHRSRLTLLDEKFLSRALDSDSEQYAKFAWESLKTLRMVFLLGTVLLRFVPRFPTYTQAELLITVTALTIFAIIELVAFTKRYDGFSDRTQRQRWAIHFARAEALCIGALLVLSQKSESDLYLLLSLPLTLAITNARPRDLMPIFMLSLATLCVGAVMADYFAGQGHRGVMTVFYRVVLVRVTFVTLGTVFGFYAFMLADAQRRVWSSLMAAMPEGMAIIDRDYRIRWVNKVMQEFIPGNVLIGRPCHMAYKRQHEQCIPCPTRAVFENAESHEEITLAPDYIGRSPQGTELLPPVQVWRRYDTYCAPLKYDGQVIGSLECAKDTTTREVLREAMANFQKAISIEQLWDMAGAAICELGYRRCCIFEPRDGATGQAPVYIVEVNDASISRRKLTESGKRYANPTADQEMPLVHVDGTNPIAASVGSTSKEELSLPWIEVPLIVGQSAYGMVAVDNKGHPTDHRRTLDREQGKQTRLITPIGELAALQAVGLQLSLAVRHIKARHDIADLLELQAHDTLGSLGLLTAYAHELHGCGGSQERDQAYANALAVIGGAQATAHTVYQWGETLRDIEASFPLFTEDIELIKIMRAVAAWCSVEARTVSCEIRLVDTPIVASLDRLVVQQVLFILVHNAVKAHHRALIPSCMGRFVEVRAERKDPNTIEFHVCDNGGGMSPDVADRLFHERVPRSARNGDGMGLGLLVARRLATLHGGDVHLEQNSPGVGACVGVVLRERSTEGIRQ